MTLDLSQLRKLAEAAEDHADEDGMIAAHPAIEDFIDALSPTVVLELLDTMRDVAAELRTDARTSKSAGDPVPLFAHRLIEWADRLS